MILKYEPTLEGFFTAASEALSEGPAEPIRQGRAFEGGLFFEEEEIATDIKKALALRERLQNKAGHEVLKTIKLAWLSEENIENELVRFIKLALVHGYTVEGMMQDSAVNRVVKTSCKVMREAHRFLGFVRFSLISKQGDDELFYSKIEPDHDILPVIAPHFADRFSVMKFILHDKKRDKAVFCENGKWRILPVGDIEITGASEDEKRFCDMWKAYFKGLGIEARKNEKLQKQLVPLKYRKNMAEFAAGQ